MFSLASLLASPLLRKALATLGVVLLLWGAYEWAYQRGRSTGEQEGKISQLQEDKKAWEADRAKFEQTLNALSDQKKAAEQRADVAEQSVAQLKQGLNDIKRAVAANVHPTDDATKLADYDALYEENQQRKQIEAKQQEQIDALKSQVDIQGKQLAATLDQLHKTEVVYAKAYNAAQKRNWFQRLFHLKGRHLDLPTPISISQ
jgi:septal ring factor EnvC (AmiA/AmiB activator)